MLDRLPCFAAISPLKQVSGEVIFIAKLERVLLVMNLYSNQLVKVKHCAGHWSQLNKSHDENKHIQTRVSGNKA